MKRKKATMAHGQSFWRRSTLVTMCVLVSASMMTLIENPAGAATSLALWNPEATPLLAVQSATGPKVPVPLTDVLNGSSGLATSLEPTLSWPDVPAGVSQVEFTIALPAHRSTHVWSGTAAATRAGAQVIVPKHVLQQGQTYVWWAQSTADRSIETPVRSFAVDVQRSNVQPLYTTGPIDVAEGTGEVVTSYTSSSLETKEGGSTFNLLYRPTGPSQLGMPAGWTLTPGSTSSTWNKLTVNVDHSVTLTSTTGGSVTFVPDDASLDSYVPDFGPHQSWPNGSATTLVPESVGSGLTQWTATEQNRVVTVFTPTSTAITTAEPSQIWSDAGVSLQQTWSDGRLQSIVDPTTGDAPYTFSYGGSPNCPDIAGVAGAIDAPTGDLCQVSDWSGQDYALSYISTPAGPQIARIVAGSGSFENAQVTDYQWDSSGRLVGVRLPLDSSAVASGDISGLGAQDPRALYQISYDGFGRVASITPPAGLVPSGAPGPSSAARPPSVLRYGSEFTASIDGQVVNAASIDPTTLLPRWTGSSLSVADRTTMTWHAATGSLISETDGATGSTVTSIYNANGQPIEQTGPAAGQETFTAYDENAQGQPWQGLAAFYYSNGSWQGAPQSGSVGPVLSGPTPPAVLQYTFTNPPPGAGAPGTWSIRLTGSYLVPSTGSYTFDNPVTQDKFFIQGAPCNPTCTVELHQGQAINLRIDVASAPNTPSVDILVTPPGGSKVPVPTSSLRPNLGYATRAWSYDSLSATSPTSISTATKLLVDYTVDPSTGEVLSETTPGGSTVYSTYNADGSPATTTTASGQTVTFNYSSANAVAAPSCASSSSLQQRGMLTSLSRPGVDDVSTTYNDAGQGSATTQGSTSVCGTDLGNPLQQATVATGNGQRVISYGAMVNNDPLQNLAATSVNASTGVERMVLNLLGQEVADIDEYGTTTTFSYSPSSGQLSAFTETTATNQARTVAYGYNADGQQTTTTVDGRLIETVSYGRTNGRIESASFANGVKETYSYASSGQLANLNYTFPDGASASDSATYSRGGRLLCHGTSAPDGTATQCYQADLDGKIIGANEVGTVPVLANNWTASYSGKQGRTGDRTELSASLTAAGQAQHGTTSPSWQTGATYGLGDALQSLNVGGSSKTLVADASGRLTSEGSTSLTYDATGHVLSAVSGASTETFGYGPSGMDSITYDHATPPVQAVHRTSGVAHTTSTRSTQPLSTSTTTPVPVPTTSVPTTVPSPVPTTPSTSTPSTSTQSSALTTTTVPPTTPSTNSTTTTGVEAPPPNHAGTTRRLSRPSRTDTGTSSPIVVHLSGQDLLLDTKNDIVGEQLKLVSGVTAGLDSTNTPTQWSYREIDGSVAWRSTGSGGPSSTAVYDPWGTWDAVASRPQPTDPLSLMMDQDGWGAGQGGATFAAAPNLVQLGNRTYDARSGRFLQPDSDLASSNLYAYAGGDPIDNVDPSGTNFFTSGWFATIVGVVVGVVAAVAVPFTAGASATLIGMVVAAATTAAVDFGASVLTQVIVNGKDNINWAEAGINSAISFAVSLGSFGLARLAATPALYATRTMLTSRSITKGKIAYRAAAGDAASPGAMSFKGIRNRVADNADIDPSEVSWWKVWGRRISPFSLKQKKASFDDLFEAAPVEAQLLPDAESSVRSYVAADSIDLSAAQIRQVKVSRVSAESSSIGSAQNSGQLVDSVGPDPLGQLYDFLNRS